MKQFTYIFAYILFFAVVACEKYNYNGVKSPASVNVIHAMPAGNPIVPVFGPLPSYYATRVQVDYGTSFMFSPQADSNALQVVPITDTAFTIFQGNLLLVSGGIYSLFLAGDTTKPDTLFVKDDIPPYSDSSSGLRFVNCTWDKKSISINLVGNDPITQTEVNNLGYMQNSAFKEYNAKSSNPGFYQFEIHDQKTGDSLTTFTWTYTTNRSNTIVIAGSLDPASATPLNIFSVNNY